MKGKYCVLGKSETFTTFIDRKEELLAEHLV